MTALLAFTEAGLFCEKGGFHIDPWGTAERAVVTHVHGDHARFGSSEYFCASPSVPLLSRRLRDETGAVEVEDRPLHDRRGPRLRAPRPRPPRQPLYRLHVRGVEGWGAGALRQGLLRLVRRGDRGARRLGAAEHEGAVRPRASRGPGPGLRAGLRGDRALVAPQAVRFPRILQWPKDKPAAEADTLEGVKALLSAQARAASGTA